MDTLIHMARMRATIFRPAELGPAIDAYLDHLYPGIALPTLAGLLRVWVRAGLEVEAQRLPAPVRKRILALLPKESKHGKA